MKIALVLVPFVIVACGGAPSKAPLRTGTPCVENSAYFTACVQGCGESLEREPVPARCIDGSFQCEAPLTPAPDCPKGSWPSKMPCGPWPGNYNCGLGCAICTDVGLWSCGNCPKASVAEDDA